MKGLTVSRAFFREVVAPLLAEHLPGLAYAAGLIGAGSEVLGFDTEMSRDHDWGPRVMLFVSREDARVEDTLARDVPAEFAGYRTLPMRVWTCQAYFAEYLGIDVFAEVTAADWLTLPQAKLCGLVGGELFVDEVGLDSMRKRFAWYPHDVWVYLMACGWMRIGQEEHLMGRAGSVGDELGASLIASRLVRDVMRLWFLMHRVYAPYAKWLGTAFARLPGDLGPVLRNVQRAETWQDAERHLVVAFERLVQQHHALGLTEKVEARASGFYERPFQVIGGAHIAAKLLAEIRDPEVARIAMRPPIGSVDTFSDSTDMLCPTIWRTILRRLYE